jgi:hypothetical protein
MMQFQPERWFWHVAGSTYWSSEAAAYVDASAVDQQRLTRIASEVELDEVLRGYGLASPLITVADVKTEAQRRIIGLVGATDLTVCLIKQLNASMRATELVNKKASGETLTDIEQTEAAQLQSLADAIKSIRSASDVIEVMNPIPSDYRSGVYWD